MSRLWGQLVYVMIVAEFLNIVKEFKCKSPKNNLYYYLHIFMCFQSDHSADLQNGRYGMLVKQELFISYGITKESFRSTKLA